MLGVVLTVFGAAMLNQFAPPSVLYSAVRMTWRTKESLVVAMIPVLLVRVMSKLTLSSEMLWPPPA